MCYYGRCGAKHASQRWPRDFPIAKRIGEKHDCCPAHFGPRLPAAARGHSYEGSPHKSCRQTRITKLSSRLQRLVLIGMHICAQLRSLPATIFSLRISFSSDQRSVTNESKLNLRASAALAATYVLSSKKMVRHLLLEPLLNHCSKRSVQKDAQGHACCSLLCLHGQTACAHLRPATLIHLKMTEHLGPCCSETRRSATSSKSKMKSSTPREAGRSIIPQNQH